MLVDIVFKKKELLRGKLNKNLKKRIIKSMIWSVVLYVRSGVAIWGSAGSRNRGPRPLGAPDHGNNLFYL